jgi:hypothetical protein
MQSAAHERSGSGGDCGGIVAAVAGPLINHLAVHPPGPGDCAVLVLVPLYTALKNRRRINHETHRHEEQPFPAQLESRALRFIFMLSMSAPGCVMKRAPSYLRVFVVNLSAKNAVIPRDRLRNFRIVRNACTSSYLPAYR